MTIDYDRDYVYWIVKNVNGASFLYKSHIDLPNGHPTIHSISLSAKGILIRKKLIAIADYLDDDFITKTIQVLCSTCQTV